MRPRRRHGICGSRRRSRRAQCGASRGCACRAASEATRSHTRISATGPVRNGSPRRRTRAPARQAARLPGCGTSTRTIRPSTGSPLAPPGAAHARTSLRSGLSVPETRSLARTGPRPRRPRRRRRPPAVRAETHCRTARPESRSRRRTRSRPAPPPRRRRPPRQPHMQLATAWPQSPIRPMPLPSIQCRHRWYIGDSSTVGQR